MGDDQQIILTNIESDETVVVLDQYLRSITSLDWHDEGIQILVGMTDQNQEVLGRGFIEIWNASMQEIVWKNTDIATVTNVEWYSSNEIAMSGIDGKIQVWDVVQDAASQNIIIGSQPLVIMSWNTDRTLALTMNDGGMFTIYDVKTSDLMNLDTENQYLVAWHPQQENEFLRIGREQIEFWSVDGESLTIKNTLNTANLIVKAMWSPDGAQLAYVGQNAVLHILDVETGQEVVNQTLPTPEFTLYRIWDGTAPMSWSPDGDIVAVSYLSTKIVLLDAHSGEILQVLEGHLDQVTSLDWHPTANILASGSLDGTVRLWDMK